MNPFELLKQYGPGYGMPLFLAVSAVAMLVGAQPPLVPLILVGIAVVWLLGYLFLSYFFLNPPDRPVGGWVVSLVRQRTRGTYRRSVPSRINSWLGLI